MVKTMREHLEFRLKREKALAMAEYVLQKLGGSDNYMHLLKLIFFADRYHLRKYLRPISTDRYVAMPNGPVASFLYDVFKGAIPDIKTITKSKTVQYNVELHTDELHLEELSESDIEAIEFSLKHFARFSEWELRDITHAYPEWAKFAEVFDAKKSMSENMYLEDFLANANPHDKHLKKFKITDPFEQISPEEREQIEKELLEYHD